MAISKTTYLELNKPDYDAIADIEVLNDNADIIDEMFDGTHLVESVNGVTPTGGAVNIDLGVTSVNGQTGAVTITERSVKQLIDIIYPVGTYYETTDATFNPNTAWAGTTWQKITDGRVLIAGGDEYTIGTNYGEKTHKITTSEMPVHNHPAAASNNGNHTHTRGSMNITGQVTVDMDNAVSSSGALHLEATTQQGFQRCSVGFMGKGITLDAANGWTGETSWNGDHSHAISIGNSGNGTAMNMLQPSKAVARWLRTA